ncbi:hypothetical protein E2C01_098709 [Portunus trituberculatus]|uniref:Uncharacterized protein n=1 Tax=Portunus trituberculatus TaxID=210409 RepID=A0A5B7K7M7_PORTR|nr:hypothetical protein [Portunus trituberculatus]
MRKRGSVTP